MSRQKRPSGGIPAAKAPGRATIGAVLRRVRGLGVLVLLLAAGLLAGGCGRVELSGFLAPYTGFRGVGGLDPALEYVAPGVDWREYRKVRIAPVEAYVQPSGGYRGVTPEDLRSLAGEFQHRLAEAFAKDFEVTSQPGPGVLDVRAAITRLRPTDPLANAAAWVAPGSFALSAGYLALTNSNLVLGEAGAEVELADSSTGRRRYAFVGLHMGSALEVQQVTRWGIVENALKGWADALAQRVKALESDRSRS